MADAESTVTLLIRGEIEAKGPLSCARFMELALYHPIYGYYQQPFQQIGCQGDFYTSVSVGPLFGRLLAFQFAQWLECCMPPGAGGVFPQQNGLLLPPDLATTQPVWRPFLVEAGAHDGRLALDILSWLKSHRPELLSQIHYCILEPSAAQRAIQQQTLEPFFPAVSWLTDWGLLGRHKIRGMIFSNELLDAFPAFRIGWNAQRRTWFEWRVLWAEARFQWTRSNILSPEVQSELDQPFWVNLPPELLAVLPDGFTTELCPAAQAWWAEAASHLEEGKLLTIDYGLEAAEFLSPHRPNGTLRAYRAHQLTLDPLADPGHQDLTTHINFTSLQETGSRAGLKTESVQSQEAFLTRILREAWRDLPRFGEWTPELTRQFQTLTHPQHLGRSFRVLQQARMPDRGSDAP